MKPEILITTKLSNAVKVKRWGISATLTFGFAPLKFLIDDLYYGTIAPPHQEVSSSYEIDLYHRVESEGLIYIEHLNPPLILVKKTKDPEEILKLSQQLVRIADQHRLEDLVLDHYRDLGFSKRVNPTLALPLLRGIQTTPTVSLERVHIISDKGFPHEEEKNHTSDWHELLRQSRY